MERGKIMNETSTMYVAASAIKEALSPDYDGDRDAAVSLIANRLADHFRDVSEGFNYYVFFSASGINNLEDKKHNDDKKNI